MLVWHENSKGFWIFSTLWQLLSMIFIPPSLLPISEFVLKETFQRNASNIAIFYVSLYENQNLFIPFLILSYFGFFLMNAIVVWQWQILKSSTNPEIGRSRLFTYNRLFLTKCLLFCMYVKKFAVFRIHTPLDVLLKC